MNDASSTGPADSTESRAVSVIVPVLNEIEHFDTAIASILAQQYAGDLEFVFVDSGSKDGTRERLAELASTHPNVRVIDNPHIGIPISLNLALRSATHATIARMDAHTRYASNYVALGVDALAESRGDWIAGPAIAAGQGNWSRWVALALSSRVGVGGADFRRATEERLTDAGFGGVIAKYSLEELGGWDESWQVNEDGELAARATDAGLRILLVPAMAAEYIPRDSVKALARQYARYGFWRAKTSVVHPSSTRPSHLLPPALVVVAIVAIVPSPVRPIAWAALVIYAVAVAIESVRLAGTRKPLAAARLFAIFATMHFSWGAANITGYLRFGSPLAAIRSVTQKLKRPAG